MYACLRNRRMGGREGKGEREAVSVAHTTRFVPGWRVLIKHFAARD